MRKLIILALILSALAGCVAIRGKANYCPAHPDQSNAEASFEVMINHPEANSRD
jgi:hypothetical protein